MSAADYDLLDRNTRDPVKPKRDLVATDGMKLTLGDTTLMMYITPGHTPGSVCLYDPRERLLFVGDALEILARQKRQR